MTRVNVLAALVLIFTSAPSLFAQAEPAAGAAAQPAPEFRYEGSVGCTRCHGTLSPQDPRDLCLFNENTRWEEDKHSRAYLLLESELGLRIGERLGWEKGAKDERCLSCHANLRADAEPAARFDTVVQQGVSCESCHGPSSEYYRVHAEDPAWRAMSAQEKQQKYGMVDVRSPLERTRQCVACHVGHVGQGKLITHEMYAAGHPPLPSFEVETFAEQMPRHWRYMPERGAMRLEAEFVQANFPDRQPRGELPRLREVVLGSLVVSAEAARLTAALADSTQGVWPELSAFDCQACHHALTSPSWRQQRGYHGVPGRPVAPRWTEALIPVAIRYAAGTDTAKAAQWTSEYAAHADALQTAFAARPFGHAEQIRASARALADWIDASLLPAATAMTADRAAATRVLDACLTGLAEAQDFHAARQLAWATRQVYLELTVGYPTEFQSPAPLPDDKDLRNARIAADVALLESWQATVREPQAEAVDRLLDQAMLQQPLALKLPAGRADLAQELGRLLRAAAEYEPRKTALQAGALRSKLIPPDPR